MLVQISCYLITVGFAMVFIEKIWKGGVGVWVGVVRVFWFAIPHHPSVLNPSPSLSFLVFCTSPSLTIPHPSVFWFSAPHHPPQSSILSSKFCTSCSSCSSLHLMLLMLLSSKFCSSCSSLSSTSNEALFEALQLVKTSPPQPCIRSSLLKTGFRYLPQQRTF